MIIGWSCVGCNNVYLKPTYKEAPDKCIKCEEIVFIRLFGEIWGKDQPEKYMYSERRQEKTDVAEEDTSSKDLEDLPPLDDIPYIKENDGEVEEWWYDSWHPFNDQILIEDLCDWYFYYT